jgi:hypothetical protein
MQAKEPFVNYAVEPQVLTIEVLQNGVMEILQNFAKLNLININGKAKVDEEIKTKFPSMNKPVRLGFDLRKISREDLYER